MENKPSIEGMMQKVKDWSNTPEYDKPVEFLKAAVNQYSFGDWGLNQLPFIHYPHVAKVMQEYASLKDERIKELEEALQSVIEDGGFDWLHSETRNKINLLIKK